MTTLFVSYNHFLTNEDTIIIKGFTQRTPDDSNPKPTVTYSVEKTGVGVLVINQPVASITFRIDSNGRQTSDINFETPSVDISETAFGGQGGDGEYKFVFSASSTSDTKSIFVTRNTGFAEIEHIEFSYPICVFNGLSQSAVRTGQTVDVTVTTAANAVGVKIKHTSLVTAEVNLVGGPTVWTGNIVIDIPPDGLQDIIAISINNLGTERERSTTDTGDDLILIDNIIPTIETFEQMDVSYPLDQQALKVGESCSLLMIVTDFESVEYTSAAYLNVINPSVYAPVKTVNYIDSGDRVFNTNNVVITARKASNCSTITRNCQIFIDDVAPEATVRFQKFKIGSFLLSPTLPAGIHDVRLTCDTNLIEVPAANSSIGTLGLFVGSGTVWDADLTLVSPQLGSSQIENLIAYNLARKLGTVLIDEEFEVDTIPPIIVEVRINKEFSDNPPNNVVGVQASIGGDSYTIPNPGVFYEQNENMQIEVEVSDNIDLGDICEVDGTNLGIGIVNLSATLPKVFTGSFPVNMGSTRIDDLSENIGRISVFQDKISATVTDAAGNSASAYSNIVGVDAAIEDTDHRSLADDAVFDDTVGISAYIGQISEFNKILLCDLSDPNAMSQNLTVGQLAENGGASASAWYFGSKISVPNITGTEQNPKALPFTSYRWRSKALKFPEIIAQPNLRFLMFGFTAGTQYRNIRINSLTDWAGVKFNLSETDPQVVVRISVDPTASSTGADWFETTDIDVSSNTVFKFGKVKDIKRIWGNGDLISDTIYLEIDLITDINGHAPQIDSLCFAFK